MESDIFIKILLSVLFGAILGLETETREIEKVGEKQASQEAKTKIGGFRTYTLISLMGGISGILFLNKLEFLSFGLFFALLGFLLIAYFMNVKIKEAFGITTEIAIVITFILGFLTTSSIIKLEVVLVVLVLMAFFLSQKRGFGKFISKIDHKEVIDVFRFGLIALVILPIFPNRVFTILDLTSLFGINDLGNSSLKGFTLGNPFQIWMIVVIISGINLLGYILSRITGEKIGLFFTSIFSGLISSTSGIISFATKSKENGENLLLAGAAIISNAVSFIIVAGLLLISNKELFQAALPIMTAVFIFGLVLGCILIFLFRSDTNKFSAQYQAFSVLPALKFVGIIIVLSLLVQILELGNVSTIIVILVTALSGVTGIDAPTIAIAGLITSGVITVDTGFSAFLLTNLVNFIAKAVYAYTIGTKNYAKYLSIGLILTAVVGLVIYFI
ncbi:MAG: MgtC/SapB family protein [Candidatus Dojkabacteria bacterium]